MNELITKNCTSEQTSLSLSALLEGCKKTRIKSIAAAYHVKVSDKMTKSQMVEALLPVMENQGSVRLKQYTPADTRRLLDAVRESACTEEAALAVTDSAPFADGLLFLTATKETVSAVVPQEFAVKVMSHCAARCFVSDEDNITRAARTCAMIYGVFTPGMLADVMNAAYGEGSCTAEQAEAFLSAAQCGEFTYADGTAVYALAAPTPVPEGAQGLPAALPSRAEIEAYSLYGLDSSEYYYRQAINFLYSNHNGSYAAANDLMKKIAVWCVTDGDWQQLLDDILAAKMPVNAAQIEFLLGIIAELSAKTRKQRFKGHRHCDIEGAEPIVAPLIRSDEDVAAEHTPVRVGQKIGRNDPCPCGSGKKFKKCHGRNMQ